MTPLSLKEKVDVNNSCHFLKKVFEEFNRSIFGNRLLNLELVPKLDKTFSFSFQKDKFLFGPNIFFLSPLEVCTAVFHEMIHAVNLKKGVTDTGGNSYHNKCFLDEALDRGIFVIKHKNHGWSLLSIEYPRNVTHDRFVRCPNLIRLGELQATFNSVTSKLEWSNFYSYKFSPLAKKEYTYKYVCSCPPPFNSLRSGRGPKSPNPPRMKCLYCGEEYRCKNG